MMNAILKHKIVDAILQAYPGVLFVSVNVAANEMQLHYQTKVVTQSTGVLSVSKNEFDVFCGMLGIKQVEKIHIFTLEKHITFYGDNNSKKVNL